MLEAELARNFRVEDDSVRRTGVSASITIKKRGILDSNELPMVDEGTFI